MYIYNFTAKILCGDMNHDPRHTQEKLNNTLRKCSESKFPHQPEGHIYLYSTALSLGKLIFFEESYTNLTWEEGEENIYNITPAKCLFSRASSSLLMIFYVLIGSLRYFPFFLIGCCDNFGFRLTTHDRNALQSLKKKKTKPTTWSRKVFKKLRDAQTSNYRTVSLSATMRTSRDVVSPLIMLDISLSVSKLPSYLQSLFESVFLLPLLLEM